MMACRTSFVAPNGERFEAGPGAVTRVGDTHPILLTHGHHFVDDPSQLGTTAWRSRH